MSDVVFEYGAVRHQLTNCGFSIPKDLSPRAIIAAVGSLYTPEETPPFNERLGLSRESVKYIAKTILPAIEKGVIKNNDRVILLCRGIGRLIAANIDSDRTSTKPPLEINGRTVIADGQTVDLGNRPDWIVDMGMGLNGLVSHVNSLREGRYAVIGILKSSGEAAIVQGAAEYWHAARNLTVRGNGIVNATNDLRKIHKNEMDLVIASRCHSTGNALEFGINAVPAMLHTDGVLIARGPAGIGIGYGYAKVARQLGRMSSMQIELDYRYPNVHDPTDFSATTEECLIVARKVANPA